MTGTHHPDQVKGRGARSNTASRHVSHTRDAAPDGWAPDDDLPPLRTEVREERPRTVISRNRSPDVAFDRSLNPYRGCEHGCIYCFARPSHAWLDLSPGLDFETRLIAKPSAPDLLAKALSAKTYVPAPLAFGTNTDPYQPIEKDRQIMRRCLKVCRDFAHPVSIVTKGSLIERDLDILAPMAERGLLEVGISVTTLDRAVARAMEPRVPPPERRLSVIRTLAGAGVPVRVLVAPVIPALTDHEIEPILTRARESGACAASMIPLRLPLEVAPLFREWVEDAFPDRAARILGRVRELHGGQDYDSRFGTRMEGQGPWAKLLKARFRVAQQRLGYDAGRPLRCDLFKVPPRAGDQLELF
ncbi:MAG: radical SAM protein [Proteobacteria bacterium]|nr:MAG: radical SAM protein [Pseudomonadota bacterium]